MNIFERIQKDASSIKMVLFMSIANMIVFSHPQDTTLILEAP